jgi:HAD superfamily hydrolase (TIGR01484 family)
MAKPVICFDFDGTLVDSQGHIHPRDVALLRENKRAHFVPATGRPLHAVRHAFIRNGIACDPAVPFATVVQNGAIVYRPGEDLFALTPFGDEDQAPLLEICERHRQVCSVLFGPERLEMLWPNAEAKRMIQRFDLDVKPFTAPSQQYTKITYISASAEAIDDLAQELASFAVEAYFSLPTVFEITRSGVDKGRMLCDLLADMGLQDAPLAAAGDGQNDLPLFTVADLTFCPSDAPQVVKDATQQEIEISDNGVLEPMLAALGA